MKQFRRLLAYLCVITQCSFVSGALASGNTNLLPMYGQPEISRTAEQKNDDKSFIDKAIKQKGGQDQAFEHYFNHAESYLDRGSLGFAIKNLNRAWLIDPANHKPYLGFARYSLMQGRTDDAIQFLDKSLSLASEPQHKAEILLVKATAYHLKANAETVIIDKNRYFDQANYDFAASINFNTVNASSWLLWANSLYDQGKYTEAHKKLQMALELNPDLIPEDLIQKLQIKLQKLDG